MAKFKTGYVVKYMNGNFSVQVTESKGTMKKTFRGVVIETDGMWPIGYKSDSWANNSFDITPIDQPNTVLTDWQRKKIEQFRNGTNDQVVIQMDELISILSEPEPPKFIPKEGEAVLVKDDATDYWKAKVFKNFAIDVPVTYPAKACNYCRPFDAALVGKVTND